MMAFIPSRGTIEEHQVAPFGDPSDILFPLVDNGSLYAAIELAKTADWPQQ